MDTSPISAGDAATVLSAIAATIAIVVAYQVYLGQKQLLQRQLLVPLWDHVAALKSIDPVRPVTYDIIKTVNTLELVARCCEREMIDANIIKRTFGDQFVTHYEDVQRCHRIPGLLQDGNTLLKQNKAATDFYNALINERVSYRRAA